MKITIELYGMNRDELLYLREALDRYFYSDSFDCSAADCEACPKRAACDSIVEAMVTLTKASKVVWA